MISFQPKYSMTAFTFCTNVIIALSTSSTFSSKAFCPPPASLNFVREFLLPLILDIQNLGESKIFESFFSFFFQSWMHDLVILYFLANFE